MPLPLQLPLPLPLPRTGGRITATQRNAILLFSSLRLVSVCLSRIKTMRRVCLSVCLSNNRGASDPFPWFSYHRTHKRVSRFLSFPRHNPHRFGLCGMFVCNCLVDQGRRRVPRIHPTHQDGQHVRSVHRHRGGILREPVGGHETAAGAAGGDRRSRRRAAGGLGHRGTHVWRVLESVFVVMLAMRWCRGWH